MNEKEQKALDLLNQAMGALRKAKPEERSEKARRFAVVITELEKVIAYYQTFIPINEE